jgi:hypothetical protein
LYEHKNFLAAAKKTFQHMHNVIKHFCRYALAL